MVYLRVIYNLRQHKIMAAISVYIYIYIYIYFTSHLQMSFALILNLIAGHQFRTCTPTYVHNACTCTIIMINCKTSWQMIYVAILRTTMSSRQPMCTHKCMYIKLYSVSLDLMHTYIFTQDILCILGWYMENEILLKTPKDITFCTE